MNVEQKTRSLLKRLTSEFVRETLTRRARHETFSLNGDRTADSTSYMFGTYLGMLDLIADKGVDVADDYLDRVITEQVQRDLLREIANRPATAGYHFKYPSDLAAVIAYILESNRVNVDRMYSVGDWVTDTSNNGLVESGLTVDMICGGKIT